MDKWSDEQLKKMKVWHIAAPCSFRALLIRSILQLGGNTALNDFLISYGPEGGYSPNMDIKEKYNSWAAAQYKEKVSSSPPRSDPRILLTPCIDLALARRRVQRPSRPLDAIRSAPGLPRASCNCVLQ